jgi:hypothetical protein
MLEKIIEDIKAINDRLDANDKYQLAVREETIDLKNAIKEAIDLYVNGNPDSALEKLRQSVSLPYIKQRHKEELAETGRIKEWDKKDVSYKQERA